MNETSWLFRDAINGVSTVTCDGNHWRDLINSQLHMVGQVFNPPLHVNDNFLPVIIIPSYWASNYCRDDPAGRLYQINDLMTTHQWDC